MSKNILDILDQEELTLEEYLSRVSDEDIEELLISDKDLKNLLESTEDESK